MSFLSRCCALLLVFACLPLFAAETTGKLPLPANPAQWINSPPIPSEALAGKGAVLWFYEEGCPRCREKWPAMLETAKQYQGKPVVFIAVNSGNPRGAVEQYLKQNGINWPTIVDTNRQFEQACGVSEVSLQNIYQCRILTATGDLIGGNPNDMQGNAERALAGASWKVDPAGMPATLMPLWQTIELGDYAAAAVQLKKQLGSSKDEIKEAATKLNDFVQGSLTKDYENARLAAENGSKWQAYKSLLAIAERYKGYNLPDDLKTQGRTLGQDEEVKKELAAHTELEAIKKGLGSTSALVRKKSFDRLEKFISDKAGSEAATEAEQLKGQLAVGG